MKKYHGIELKEVTESQVFDPPKEMLVWNSTSDTICKRDVCAIASKELDYPVLTTGGNFRHCAPIPEPESKPVTNRELSRWLAKGNGQLRKCTSTWTIFTCLAFTMEEADKSVDEGFAVCKWDDTEWHKPTREYLGLEDKQMELRAEDVKNIRSIAFCKENEQLKRELDETKEQLRIANAKEKDWRGISSQANVRRVEWKKMATDLMERFVETKAELEVTKLPF